MKEDNNNNSDCCNMSIVVLSCILYIIHVIIDSILVIDYWRRAHIYWAGSTLLLILLSTIIVNIFSMRWHIIDGNTSSLRWLSHICLIGIFHRYYTIFEDGFPLKCSGLSDKSSRYRIGQGDLCILHLFESFLKSAPQLILQLYIISATNDWHIFTGISAAVSSGTLLCAIVSYGRIARRPRPDYEKLRKYGILVQIVWRSSMLAVRLSALFLFAIGFREWIFALLGAHWFVMTLWIIYQKTEFCPTRVEEIFYNCVAGVIYCFSFYNLKKGESRYRIITFYCLMICENMMCLLVFIFYSPQESLKRETVMVIFTVIVCGSILGIICMILYYRWLHPAGSIIWTISSSFKRETLPDELSSDLRSLKTTRQRNLHDLLPFYPTRFKEANTEKSPGIVKSKKLQRSINNPVLQSPISDLSGIEFYSVVNSPEYQKNSSFTQEPHESSRNVKILTESAVKYAKADSGLVYCEKYSNEESAKRRRAICSSAQLDGSFVNKVHSKMCKNHTDPNNDMSEKTSSDSINVDLDMTFSDINSSDINEFNENIVQKLCLSTLKNIKNVHQDADIENIQRIALDILKDLYNKGGALDDQDLQSEISSSLGRDLETPSEVLSAHDYENICAVNIAREAWGLRSWRGCVDMEASSPPPPLPARGNIPSAPPLLTPSPLSSPHQDYEIAIVNSDGASAAQYHKYSETSTYLAKPYVVDQHGRVLPLCIPLEPIMEEIDEFKDIKKHKHKRQRYNSSSSLVATIDEIRNDSITNSPRNVYHRSSCDSPYLRNFNEKSNIFEEKTPTPFAKKVIQNKTSNISSKLKELDDELRVMDLSKSILESCKKNYCKKYKKNSESVSEKKSDMKYLNNAKIESNLSTLNVLKYDKESILHDKNMTKENSIRKTCNSSFEKVSFISQLMIENESAILKGITNNNTLKSSSLQSLIDNDNSDAVKYAERLPGNKKHNRPRRKFSLLREKFELKSKFSDEETLFQSLESIKSSHGTLEKITTQDFNAKSTNIDTSISNDVPLSELSNADKIKNNGDGTETTKISCDIPYSKDSVSFILKEKRSLFLKQVLSPPKINSWNKKM